MSNMVYKDSSTRKRMQDAYLLLLSCNYFFRNYGHEFNWLHVLKFTREVANTSLVWT